MWWHTGQRCSNEKARRLCTRRMRAWRLRTTMGIISLRGEESRSRWHSWWKGWMRSYCGTGGGIGTVVVVVVVGIAHTGSRNAVGGHVAGECSLGGVSSKGRSGCGVQGRESRREGTWRSGHWGHAKRSRGKVRRHVWGHGHRTRMEWILRMLSMRWREGPVGTLEEWRG